MKKATFISSLLLLLLTMFGNGCTVMLWSKDEEPDHWPARDANLQLFDSRKRQDVLVVYQEASRRREAGKTRGYWLYANEQRITQERRPEFVGANRLTRLARLTPVPVFVETNRPVEVSASNLYAVRAEEASFTLFSGPREVSTHTLPAYNNDGLSTAARVALTPLTVVADATMVAGAIVVLAELNSLDHGDSDDDGFGCFCGGHKSVGHARSPDGHHGEPKHHGD